MSKKGPSNGVVEIGTWTGIISPEGAEEPQTSGINFSPSAQFRWMKELVLGGH